MITTISAVTTTTLKTTYTNSLTNSSKIDSNNVSDDD